MAPSDTKLKRAVSLAVTDRFTDADWTMLALQTGTTDVINSHPRLLRSLRFGDDDYPSCVAWVLNRLFKEVGPDDLLRVVEDLIDLPIWLRENHPNLYNDIYGAETEEGLKELERLALAEDVDDVPRHIGRIRRSISSDPELAIGSAKEMLESVLKTILDDRGVEYSRTADIPLLVKLVRQCLEAEAGREGIARDRILNGLANVAGGVSDLRNLRGTGHGRSRTHQPDTIYAHLAVTSSAAIAQFLWEVHKAVEHKDHS